ncbi:hypothetical protein [Streptomyces sp. NBC_01614]|uniref:hypothetical protein n=1 Tax=Streptomyces sp. NBC_01614 TaxID=2975897 RepID=UPI003866E424
MGGHELAFDLGPCVVPRDLRRAAAVHVADRIAAEHPDRTAAELAADPLIATGLRELLAALDLNSKEQP